MSPPIQLLILAILLFLGIFLAFIGLDMAGSPTVYSFLNPDLCVAFGYTLIPVGFIPAFLMTVYILGWGRGGPLPQGAESPSPQSVAEPRPQGEPPLMARAVSVELLKSGAGDQAIVPARDTPHLIGLTGGLPNRVTVPEGVFTIGRAPDNKLVLTSQLVSRHHCKLEWSGEKLTIEDLDSSNATHVNDQKVSGRTLLNEGDVIRIVDYALEVELPPSLAETLKRPEGQPDPAATIRLPAS